MASARESYLDVMETLRVSPTSSLAEHFSTLQTSLLDLQNKQSKFLESCFPALVGFMKRENEEDEEEDAMDDSEDSTETKAIKYWLPNIMNLTATLIENLSSAPSLTELQNRKYMILWLIFAILEWPLAIADTDEPNVSAIASQLVSLLSSCVPSPVDVLQPSRRLKWSSPHHTHSAACQHDHDDGQGSDIPKWTELGLSHYAYLLVVAQHSLYTLPAVFSPAYLFGLFLPSCFYLLNHGSPVCQQKGLALLELIQVQIPPESAPSPALLRVPVSTVLDTLTRLMASSPAQDLRTRYFNGFKRFIGLFKAERRFDFMEHIITETRSDAVASVVLDLIRSELTSAYAKISLPKNNASLPPPMDNFGPFSNYIPSSVAADESPFVSPRLLDLLEAILTRQEDLEDVLDATVSALNTLRMAILMEQRYAKQHGKPFYLNTKERQRISQRWLEPLAKRFDVAMVIVEQDRSKQVANQSVVSTVVHPLASDVSVRISRLSIIAEVLGRIRELLQNFSDS